MKKLMPALSLVAVLASCAGNKVQESYSLELYRPIIFLERSEREPNRENIPLAFPCMSQEQTGAYEKNPLTIPIRWVLEEMDQNPFIGEQTTKPMRQILSVCNYILFPR